MDTLKTKHFFNYTNTILLLILLVVLSRLVPHMHNFSPLGAISLFGAAYFLKKWHAFILPIIAVWVSDLFVNNLIYSYMYPTFRIFYEGFFWQYGSYLLITFCGTFIFKKINLLRIISASLFSTIIFFLVTNFGFWFSSPFYTKDFGGLITCYVAAVPFIKGTFIGDAAFSLVLFGSFYLLQQKFPHLKTISISK